MPQQTIDWNRRVPIAYRVDVAVLGGGIAGVCAACSAAAEGASVLLVERLAVPGGNATVGGVANWSGETAGQGGVFDRIIEMQQQWNSIAPYPGPARGFRNCNRVFDHEALALILPRLLEDYGVELLLHTRFVDIRRHDNVLGPAVVAGVSGLQAVEAQVFVDTTGSGEVARAAGCRMLPPGPLGPLPPSMMAFVRELPEAQPHQLPPDWFSPMASEDDLPMTSPWPAGPGARALKIKVPGFDSGVTDQLSALEIAARRRAIEVIDYYQRHDHPGWRLDHLSPMVGLRETRRIAGEYVLTVEDLRAGRAFDDAVARGVFYLDGMRPDDPKRTYLLSHDEQLVPPYHIPLGSLVVHGVDNLLTAGRSLSADQLALSSARVMTTCAMTGQAAGVAAAHGARTRAPLPEVDGSAIRARLEQLGADLSLD